MKSCHHCIAPTRQQNKHVPSQMLVLAASSSWVLRAVALISKHIRWTAQLSQPFNASEGGTHHPWPEHPTVCVQQMSMVHGTQGAISARILSWHPEIHTPESVLGRFRALFTRMWSLQLPSWNVEPPVTCRKRGSLLVTSSQPPPSWGIRTYWSAPQPRVDTLASGF